MDRLHEYDHWLEKNSKKVTDKSVYLDVNGHFKDKTEVARLVKYNKPTEFEVVFKENFYQHNQNKPTVIKGIMAHELAHINHPNTHDAAFKEEAKKLGAGRYAVAHGKSKR